MLFVVRSKEPPESSDVQFSVLKVSHVQRLFDWMEELVPIHEGLQYSGSRVKVVVHGLSGMGRSQLAPAYAEGHKKTIQLCSG
jgi:hypothetical protein